jgi:hypothetical protein
MPSWSISSAQMNQGARSFNWIDSLLALTIGCAGGAVASALLTTSLVRGSFLGGLFGLAFGLFFAHRATSSGAGYQRGYCLSCQGPPLWPNSVTHAIIFVSWLRI